MASFEKVKTGYRAHVQSKGQRDSGTFPTKREAQLWAAQKEIEFQTVAKGRVGELKFTHAAFTRYAEEVCPTHKGERWEIVRIEKLKREFPNIALAQVDQKHIQAWRDTRLFSVGPSSVLREMKLLNSIFEHCRREWHWITVNPCVEVKRPKAPKHRERVISASEIRLMLRALGYPRRELASNAVAHAFLLALRTGMRAGELAVVEWCMVRPNFIRLPPENTKNGLGRDVPLSNKAKRLLAKMRGYHDTSVFDVGAASIDVLFRKARDKAGLSGFTWHDSRHTAATWIGRSGKWSVIELCKAFGWSDPRMAMIYVNPSADDLAAKL